MGMKKLSKAKSKPTIKITINDGPFRDALKNLAILRAHLVDFVQEEYVQRRAVTWAPEWD